MNAMSRSSSYDGSKCAVVAEKLSQIFGWRQTYNVEKLQKNVQYSDIARISIIRSNRAESLKSKNKEAADSWVAVRNLKSQGGGILDPDDRLSDVVDDREQIFVSFESDDGIHHHVGGDGASGSSDGTGSPDLFKDVGRKYGYHKMRRSSIKSRTDIEVTGANLANGSHIVPTLQVRRGSEPNLTQIDQQPPMATVGVIRSNPGNDRTKRWSAAPLILEPQTSQLSWQRELNTTGTVANPPDVFQESTDHFWRLSRDSMIEPINDTATNEFVRLPRNNTNRLSMQFISNGSGTYTHKPVDRTFNSKVKMASRSLPRDQKRKEPLGQANSATSSPTAAVDLDFDRSEIIVIRNDTGPLGIHVIPDYDRDGKDMGLLVQGIDPDGRVYLDGRLALHDRIIEINGQSVLNLPFQRVQEMFKLSLISPELRLRIIKADATNIGKPPPPVYPSLCDNKENISKMEVFKKYDTANMKIATVSPTKKLGAISRHQKCLLNVNTRKIGRKIELELMKAPPPHGLGFSITTRDNPAGGNCPIYIKNIIPKGAAIQDGRLKIGDRLLEVNDVEMTGKSQSEAVSVLRNVTAGSKVRIVVSRQEDISSSELPRIMVVDSPLDHSAEPCHHNAASYSCSTYSANKDVNSIGVSSKLTSSAAPDSLYDVIHAQQLLQSRSSIDVVPQSVNISNDIYCQPTDVYGEISTFPWKYKQVLTLDIPVHDSEKAGLGISVKGKTSGSQDLGIFIKSVINGGAASRDRRLRTNDQLLNVNNISLLYQSNSDAMETLRKAMLHTEGPVPGNITLTIARKAPHPSMQTHSHQNVLLNRSFHDYYLSPAGQTDSHKSKKAINRSFDNSSAHISSFVEQGRCLSKNGNAGDSRLRYEDMNMQRTAPNFVTDNVTEKSNSSTNTVIFNPKQAQMNDTMTTWNPVLDKLTEDSKKQLRNESYYKATNQHDTSTYMAFRKTMDNHVIKTPFGETLLIEDDYGNGLRLPQHKMLPMNLPDRSDNYYVNNFRSKTVNDPVYVRTIANSAKAALENVTVISTDENALKSAIRTTNNNRNLSDNIRFATSATSEPASRSLKTCLSIEADDVSQHILNNPPTGFSRDAFGRQSMSEKRHAALDAKTTDTYQRSKKIREKRGKHKADTDTLEELGPSLGLKKSSSLESLQTMVQEVKIADSTESYNYRGEFERRDVFLDENRKAVSHNTNGKHNAKKVMDSDHQTKISAKKHWLLDPPNDLNIETRGFDELRGTLRQSSLNTTYGKIKHTKKKSGLLKGIGIMFR